jgi:probable rRNA maturation factor
MMLRRGGRADRPRPVDAGNPPHADDGGEDPDPAGAGPDGEDPAPADAPVGHRTDAVVVEVSDDQGEVDVDAAGLRALASAVLAAEGVGGPAELTLTFVDEQAMAALNGEYMGEAGPTDVLAFPLDDPDEALPPGMAALLGDVVVCPAVARRYAAEQGRSTEHELALLVVHGVLHVLGHDHADDDEASLMREREIRHLRSFVDDGFVR